MKAIVAALNGGEAADKLWTDGLHVAGERYVVFKVEGRSIYGRKVHIPPYPLYPIAPSISPVLFLVDLARAVSEAIFELRIA